MTPEQIAQEHNLDPRALRSLLDYLERAVNRATPAQLAVIRANLPLFLETGVKRWHEQSMKFYSQLLNDTDENSIAMRTELAHSVWASIRQEKGLTT